MAARATRSGAYSVHHRPNSLLCEMFGGVLKGELQALWALFSDRARAATAARVVV